MVENRRKIRFECHATLTIEYGRHTCEGEVLDISQGGLRLTSSADLSVGRKVSLSLPDGSRRQKAVKAVVRWIRRGRWSNEIGLEFQAPPQKLAKRWIRKLFPDEGAAWKQSRQKRDEVRAEVNLPMAVGDYREGAVLDVSRSGARFVLDSKLENQTDLFICLPFTLLELQAEVLRAQQREDKWVHSVRFREVPQNDQETLNAYVESVAKR